MKKIALIFFVSLYLPGNARNVPGDSLELVLNPELADTSVVLLMAEVAEKYWYSNPDTSFHLAQKGFALARQIGFIKGEANCLRNMGVILDLSGNYPAALEHYLQALEKYETLNDHNGIIKIYADIGAVYAEQGDYGVAIPYTLKSKALAESIGKPDYSIIGLLNLGDFYEKLNKLDSALICTNQAYELSLRYNELFISGIALNNLGNIHSKMKQGIIAMGYYHQSLALFKGAVDHEAICETTLGMAKIFADAGRADSALYYSRLSMASAYASGFTKRILNASLFLTNYYKERNLVDSAYHYQAITMAAKDSLFSQEKIRKVQNLNFLEQIRQQEIAEAKRLALAKRKEKIQMLGVGTFIPFFFGILMLFSKKTHKRKTIRFLGLLGTLLLFEFIAYLLDPFIVSLSLDIPLLNLLFLVLLASLLVPLNNWMDDWVNEKLAPDTK
ncbi:MAG TPA: tetratricopeptide repeat protein [Prolixibacteraceae bacterium]|nr:tetratricopeptide repeat protein [Prolixibacteraceae bacterium]